MSQALTLPSLDATAVTLINQLCHLSHQLFAQRILPAQLIADFSPRVQKKTLLALRWDNLPIYLYLDSTIQELAAALLPDDIDLSSLSEDIALALFEQTFLADYQTLLEIPLHLQQIDDASLLPDDCHVLQWQPGHPILRGQLCIPRAVAPALLQRLTESFNTLFPDRTASPLAPLLATLPIPIRMELGEMTLSLNEIKKLEKNDLLLPEKSYIQSNELYLRLSDTLGFTVKLENDACIVLTYLESYRAHMDNNEHDFDDDFKKFLEEAPDAPYDEEVLFDTAHEDDDTLLDNVTHEDSSEPVETLDDVPIRLTFDVGYLQLTLGELSQIIPGHTFNLGKSIHKAVTIRANGTAIGTGELVDIEGNIGVNIVALQQKGQG